MRSCRCGYMGRPLSISCGAGMSGGHAGQQTSYRTSSQLDASWATAKGCCRVFRGSGALSLGVDTGNQPVTTSVSGRSTRPVRLSKPSSLTVNISCRNPVHTLCGVTPSCYTVVEPEHVVGRPRLSSRSRRVAWSPRRTCLLAVSRTTPSGVRLIATQVMSPWFGAAS